MRLIPLPFGPPIGWLPLKYLLDVGFTRTLAGRRPGRGMLSNPLPL